MVNTVTYSEEKIEFKKVDYLKDTSTLGAIANSPATKAVTNILSIVTFLLSSSFGMVIVKLFQIFDILKFVKISMPLNFKAFIALFEDGIFDFLPNPFVIDEVGYCVRHEILVENDQDCFILNSAGGILAQIIGWILLKVVILGILTLLLGKKRASTSNQSGKKKLSGVEKANNKFNMGFYVNLMLAVNIDLNIAVFSNIRDFWIKPFVVFLNSTTCLIVLCIYVKLIIKILTKSSLLEFEKEFGKVSKLIKPSEEESLISGKNKIRKGKSKKLKRRRRKTKINFKVELDEKSKKSKFDSSTKDLINFTEDKQDDFTQDKNDWEFLREDVKPEISGVSALILQIQVARDFLVCMFVICFLNHPLM